MEERIERHKAVKGVMLDLDGVLYVGSRVIEGAVAAVTQLQQSGLPCRFITNTSTLSLASLQAKINHFGFNVRQHEIVSATQAALLYLERQKNPVCRLLLADDVRQDFAHFPQSDHHPNYIIVGDIGDAWSYALLNEVFNALMQGAQLVAIHKNRYWQTEHGLQMDIGAFVEGLEYATGRKAMMMGKPSAEFFAMALASMHMDASDTIIVGDDIDSDVGGGQQAGMRGILVQTGKYRQPYTEASAIKPDAVLASIAELPAWLGI